MEANFISVDKKKYQLLSRFRWNKVDLWLHWNICLFSYMFIIAKYINKFVYIYGTKLISILKQM